MELLVTNHTNSSFHSLYSAEFLTYIAWNPTAINYNSDEPVMKLIGATILSLYYIRIIILDIVQINEEYKANKLRSYLALSSGFSYSSLQCS